jgi:hypothetical protein
MASKIRFLMVLFAASALMAAEYHGTVKPGTLVLPGATVTATQGDRTLVTGTDERGVFRFVELADGVWNIEVRMLGFEGMRREVGIAPGAPAPEWQLKFLPESALLAALEYTSPAPPEATHPSPAPAASATPKAAAPAPPSSAAAPVRRPSSAFQRVDVNQAADTATPTSAAGALKTEEMADLTQNAANSFIVQGSMSSAAGLGQQNDWGPRGMDGGPMTMMGGGPGGGGPPPGGGGPGMMMGGGGRGGGRGGPDWQRGPNAMAFGNGRRNPQNSYQMGANFSVDNSALDARSFSVTGADVGKPAYAAGRGGVMLGGPLRIPGLVSASKRILFNINYEFQRNHTGTTSNPVNMPTVLERAGDFSGLAFTVYDLAAGSPFPNNVIPANRISSTETALLQYYPNPNLAIR